MVASYFTPEVEIRQFRSGLMLHYPVVQYRKSASTKS